MRVAHPTAYGSPLHDAGVDREDILESVDGQRVTTERELVQVIQAKQPGDQVTITFQRRGRGLETTLTLAERPHITLVTVETDGATLTSQQQRFREAWLGSTQ